MVFVYNVYLLFAVFGNKLYQHNLLYLFIMCLHFAVGNKVYQHNIICLYTMYVCFYPVANSYAIPSDSSTILSLPESEFSVEFW